MQYTALQVDYFEHVYNHCLVFIFNRAGCSLDRPVYFCEQWTFPRLQNFFHKLDTSRFCFFIHGGQICRLGSFTNASDPLICFLTSLSNSSKTFSSTLPSLLLISSSLL